MGSSLVDDSGSFSRRIRIPLSVSQGTSHNVVSESEGRRASAVHHVRSSKISASSTESKRGDELTILANGFKPNSMVTGVFISNIAVMRSPIPTTDSNGNAKIKVTIPRIPAGDSLIKITIGGETHYSYIFIK